MPARILAFDTSRGDEAGARIDPVSATVHASDRDWPGDERAVSRFLSGDVLGFEQIVRHYSGMVFALAARLVGPADAEDVVQETFLRAWHGLERFRGDSSLKTWLYAIALNRARARHGTLARLRAVFTPGRTRDDDAFASLDDASDPRSVARGECRPRREAPPAARGAAGPARRVSRGGRPARPRRPFVRGDRRGPRRADRHRA